MYNCATNDIKLSITVLDFREEISYLQMFQSTFIQRKSNHFQPSAHLKIFNHQWELSNEELCKDFPQGALAILKPLEENPYKVPHLKALISCKKFWGQQRYGCTLSLWNSLLKISILLHFIDRDRSGLFWLHLYV